MYATSFVSSLGFRFLLRLRRFIQSFHVGFIVMISVSGCFMVLVTEEGLDRGYMMRSQDVVTLRLSVVN